jgi:leucine dehydrogenase
MFDLFNWMEDNAIKRFYYNRGKSSCVEINGEKKWIDKPIVSTVVQYLISHGHEEVLFSCYPDVGLRSIIAIHDTTLAAPLPRISTSSKPALGGCRFWNFRSFKEMLDTGLRLAEAMTKKAAAVEGLKLGGAKSVVWTANPQYKSFSLLKQFALEIESLGGRYIGGEDANCSVSDIETMSLFTHFLAGRANDKYLLHIGGMGSGDPSPITAEGLIKAMKACIAAAGMKEGFSGKTVFVHGLGKVGLSLCRLLRQRGVTRLLVCDVKNIKVESAMDEFGLTKEDVIDPGDAFSVECDIYAPCLTEGGILNEGTIPQLKCGIIVGATNNQLEDPERDGRLLFEKGVIYAPDYVANAGGLINVADELEGYDLARVKKKVNEIYDRMLLVLFVSKEWDKPTNRVADILLAKSRLFIARHQQ